MIKISKKKKTKTTKWSRTHEFKRKNSNKKGVGHPVYVYAKSKRSLKYLLFTHKPPEGKDDAYEKLIHNIDPDEDGIKDSYVKKQYETSRYDAFKTPDKKYRIHDDDRDTIKKYKK